MARKPQTTAVANWDEELAKAAQVGAALAPSGGGGKFFSLKAGQLSYDDTPMPGNQAMVVIASWCLENVYYGEEYDPDNRVPPTCFAFCKSDEDQDEMGPPTIVDSEDAFERQSDECKSCPQNQWGSALRGKGKACSNRRRLALLPAGTYKSLGKGKGFELEMFDDEAHFRKADAGYLKVPVMSGKTFDAYVRQLAETIRRPTFAVFTRISVVPDPKSQFKVEFEMEDVVPNELLPAIMARHTELDKEIDFPYQPIAEEDKPAPARASQSKKLAGRGKR